MKTERVVSNPENHGWEEVNGKWIWASGRNTGHIVDGDTEGQIATWHDPSNAWTPSNSVIVDSATGNVGVGTDSPNSDLHVFNSSGSAAIRVESSANGDAQLLLGPAGNSAKVRIRHTNSGNLDFLNDGGPYLTIDASGDSWFYGDVHIPQQIAFQQTGGNAHSIKADSDDLIFTSVTGGKESLRLTYSGNATFSGTVSANVVALEGNAVSPLQIKGNVAGAVQIRMENTVNNLAMHVRINDAGAYEWVKNDYSAVVASIDQAGNIDAAGFTVNGQPIGGGGLPDGDFTHNGKITATDFIATSDERVKDNISTAPVGLIDSLKGREWDWSESGEKGSGVVAQELEEVLPHLVHTDDEGMKSVAYNGLVAYLIEEIKALKAEVEALK